MKTELVGFYIRKEIYNEKHEKIISNDYLDIAKTGQQVTLDTKFSNQVILSRSVLEGNEYKIEFLQEVENQIFIPFISSKKLMGFAIISSNKFFKFWHYDIFDSMISHVGIIIDRIKAYQEISSQEQRLLQDKAESLKTLAGSIAHELRNPLNTINLAQNAIKELLLDKNSNNGEKINELNSHIANSVSSANNIINIILSDLKDKPIEPSDFSYLSTDVILPEVIKKYGYNGEAEKDKVKLILNNKEDNFIFKAVEERFTFIIYNLLKNALYYLKEYPDSVVTVGVETSQIPSL